MGRKLAFNRDDALQKAMESFWVRGYKKTSMRDLAGQLDLHLGSVYNALGTKEVVFEEALRLYFDLHVLPRLRTMQNDPNPLAAIERFINDVAEECTHPTQGFGCFLINSLHEVTKINESVTSFVHKSIRQQEEVFTAVILRGQEMGQINPHKDPVKLGRFIVAMLFSLWTLAKLGVSGERIRDVKECAIEALKS